MNSPFNEKKYKSLLEGLEISVLKFSDIPFENLVFRIDAEYFQKNYLIEDKQRIKFKTIYLGEDYMITDGQHGYHEVDDNSEIRHLTAKNFKNWFANDDDTDRLAKWVDENNKRSSLKINDVILTTRGSVGYCAIVKQEVLPANIDQDVARISLKKQERINPQFLITYVNSKFGKDWTKRNQTGMVQQGLALWRINELPIPELKRSFQNKIKEVIENGHESITKSVSSYCQAETLLLETLGLKDFRPCSDPINLKSFKESFFSTGRLDAEYYQKRYEEIEKSIKSFKAGFTTVSNEFSLSKEVIKKIMDFYNYTEISDVNVSDGSISYNKLSVDELPDNGKMILKKDQIIISRVRPNRGAIGIIRECPENYVGSGAFTILSENGNYKKEVLQTLLRSKPYQELIMKYNVGSSYPVVKNEDILNLPIPKLEKSQQQEIAELVEESFRLKKQSEQLLEIAKQAVEMAIEQDESKAMEFINKQINQTP